MKKLLLAVMCVAVLVPTVALAAGVDDADDTSGRLDIKYTGAHIEGNRLEFEVEMYQEWPNRLFPDRGSLRLLFNTRGDRRPDVAVIAPRGRSGWDGLFCVVDRREGGEPTPCTNAKVWRSEADSIELSVARWKLMDDNESTYAWRAKTRLRFANGCPDTGAKHCIDRALGKQAD